MDKEIKPVIDPVRCAGCAMCVAVCPGHVLTVQFRRWKMRAVVTDPASCRGCGRCASICTRHAITLETRQAVTAFA